jgi:hypothetical protein
MNPTTTTSTTTSATPTPFLNQLMTGWSVPFVALLLFLLALTLILLPFILSRFGPKLRNAPAREIGTSQYAPLRTLFEIPYMTWFLLHLCFGGLGLLAIVTLALAGGVSQDVVSTLLASLFGYVLVSAARGTGATDTSTKTTVQISTPSPLPHAKVGVAYNQSLHTSGGTAPYTWAPKAGTTLPVGLTIDHATGVLNGTPTVAGTFHFSIQVTDANHTAAEQLFELTVDP